MAFQKKTEAEETNYEFSQKARIKSQVMNKVMTAEYTALHSMTHLSD